MENALVESLWAESHCQLESSLVDSWLEMAQLPNPKVALANKAFLAAHRALSDSHQVLDVYVDQQVFPMQPAPSQVLVDSYWAERPGQSYPAR